jgi:hypothetical protein
VDTRHDSDTSLRALLGEEATTPPAQATMSIGEVQRRVEQLANRLQRHVPAYQTTYARCQGLTVVIPELGKRPRLPAEAWPLVAQRLGLTE